MSHETEIQYNETNQLLGLLGHREYEIFGDKQPFLLDLGSMIPDDEWSLDEDEESSEFLAEGSFDRRLRETFEDKMYNSTRQKLSQTLLMEHETFMQGKRATFIESQPYAHEAPDREPKFSLPFSPVKNSTYDIKSVASGDDEDGDLISMTSQNLPGDDESHPGSRPQTDRSNSEIGLDNPNLDALIAQSQRRHSRLPSDVRNLRKSLMKHQKEAASGLDVAASKHRRGTEMTGHSVISKIHTDHSGHDFFSPKEKETYFGHHARKDFFYKYKEVSRRSETIPDRDCLTSGGRSPRSEYLAEISKKGLLPWPVLLRSTTAPKVLDLSGMGLGDDVIKSFTSILDKLPQVDTLLLSDNR